MAVLSNLVGGVIIAQYYILENACIIEAPAWWGTCISPGFLLLPNPRFRSIDINPIPRILHPEHLLYTLQLDSDAMRILP
jgi:hypothetical protein